MTTSPPLPYATDGITVAPVREAARTWRPDGIIPVVTLAAVIGIVYGAAITTPMRLWDHHAILLLAKAPQFGEHLLWHLVHYQSDAPNPNTIYFRVLAMPAVYAIGKVLGDHTALYYLLHFAAHLAVCLVLYAIARRLSGDRTLSLLTAVLFALFSAHGDTATLPFYTFMFAAVALAGAGLVAFLDGWSAGDARRLSAGIAAVALATLIYDASFLLALSLAAALIFRGIVRADRMALRTGIGALVAELVLFGGVIGLFRFSAEAGRGVGRALHETAFEVLRDNRLWSSVWFGLWAPLSDLLVFLGGHQPGVWHRGNIPYWDPGLFVPSRPALGALALMVAALVAAARPGYQWRVPGALAFAIGVWLDPQTVPLALIVGGVLALGRWRAVDARVLFPAAAAVLVSLNIALGRPDGYNVLALRHHYLTSFFVLAALSGVAGALLVGRLPWQRLAVHGTLAVCIVVNAATTLQLLANVRIDNEGVFAFDRQLRATAERFGPGSLFVTFPPSAVQGRDWRGFPAHEVTFDVLHAGTNALTRHVVRAPFVMGLDGEVRPNPAHGRAPGDDFAVHFLLAKSPPPQPHELFGSAPREPRVVISREAVSLVGTRLADGRRTEWRFPFPSELRPPVTITLARRGDTIEATANGGLLGRAPVPPEHVYHGWTSDNLELLGRGYEPLMISLVVYHCYVRIGTGVAESF